MEDVHFVGFLSKLLETKILQVLRFKHGQVFVFCLFWLFICCYMPCSMSQLFLRMYSCKQIYSVGVSVFLGGNKPSRVGNVRGDISVNFSCDPDISSALVIIFFPYNFFAWFVSLKRHHLSWITEFRLILLWMRYYVFKRKALQMMISQPFLKLSKELMKMDYRSDLTMNC